MARIDEVTKTDAAQVRSTAYAMALDTNRGRNVLVGAVVNDAKEIEKFLWGGLAPIEKAPTPLSTIQECIAAAHERLEGYIASSEGIDVERFKQAKASLERFAADLDAAFQVKK